MSLVATDGLVQETVPEPGVPVGVRPAAGDVKGDPAGRVVGLALRLAREVGAQREQHGRPGGHRRDGDHQRGAERHLGLDGAPTGGGVS
ncbi:hypothetical protein PV417_02775 [Streptomyces sp. ME19-03-3]|nr:hypothetical protein [Streptomyces sp. ME19-03-3]